MASLELNKAMAAVLTAGVLASGTGVLSRILYQPEELEEPAYLVAVPEEGAAPEGGEPAGPQPIAALLAAADPAAGETVAKKCTACHAFEQGGPNKVGPVLWDVVGRDIASVEGFSYSEALNGLEGDWNYDALSGFLHDPQGYAPGTKMSFAGIPDDEDRANLIAYMRSLAEEPLPLPEVPAEEAPAAEGGEVETAAVAEGAAEGGAAPAGEGAAGGGEAVAMVAEADVAHGESVARACAACHAFEQGGPNKVGPVLWDVIGRDIATVEGFSYSDALASKEGAWDYAALDAFLANPREWAPGTRMTYAGIDDAEDRAALIAYLRSLSENPAPLPGGG